MNMSTITTDGRCSLRSAETSIRDFCQSVGLLVGLPWSVVYDHAMRVDRAVQAQRARDLFLAKQLGEIVGIPEGLTLAEAQALVESTRVDCSAGSNV